MSEGMKDSSPGRASYTGRGVRPTPTDAISDDEITAPRIYNTRKRKPCDPPRAWMLWASRWSTPDDSPFPGVNIRVRAALPRIHIVKATTPARLSSYD